MSYCLIPTSSCWFHLYVRTKPTCVFSFQTILLAEKLELYSDIYNLIVNTTEHHMTVRKLIEGFTEEFLHSLPTDTLVQILRIYGKPISHAGRVSIHIRVRTFA